MKRIVVTLYVYLLSCYCLAQRYDDSRLYDFGLADSKELSHSLSIAIPCLVLGFIICWVTMWGRPQAQSNPDDKLSYLGCGGCLIMAIGGFFLLPLLAYVELAVQVLVSIAFIIVCIYAIYSWIKSKL
ncbi:MAG: hypothetical protein SPK85_07205 [Prevotella sp.]|nr:hypothetical protein [Prevotella sp.]